MTPDEISPLDDLEFLFSDTPPRDAQKIRRIVGWGKGGRRVQDLPGFARSWETPPHEDVGSSPEADVTQEDEGPKIQDVQGAEEEEVKCQEGEEAVVCAPTHQEHKEVFTPAPQQLAGRYPQVPGGPHTSSYPMQIPIQQPNHRTFNPQPTGLAGPQAYSTVHINNYTANVTYNGAVAHHGSPVHQLYPLHAPGLALHPLQQQQPHPLGPQQVQPHPLQQQTHGHPLGPQQILQQQQHPHPGFYAVPLQAVQHPAYMMQHGVPVSFAGPPYSPSMGPYRQMTPPVSLRQSPLRQRPQSENLIPQPVQQQQPGTDKLSMRKDVPNKEVDSFSSSAQGLEFGSSTPVSLKEDTPVISLKDIEAKEVRLEKEDRKESSNNEDVKSVSKDSPPMKSNVEISKPNLALQYQNPTEEKIEMSLEAVGADKITCEKEVNVIKNNLDKLTIKDDPKYSLDESSENAKTSPAEVVSVTSPEPAPVVPAVKAMSWANLVRSNTTEASDTNNSASELSSKPLARIPPFAVNDQGKGAVGKDGREKELGAILRNLKLQFHSTPLLPRGLTNRSNWCFVNSILQALLACPPFYNLLRALPCSAWLTGGKSKTPMLDSLGQFVSEFSPIDLQVTKPLAASGGKKDKNRKREDIVTGVSLEPSYVYKMLLELGGTFKVVEGRQEDAEEFLTCLLNGLSEEMQGLIKLATPEDTESEDTNEEETDETNNDDADDWQEVGAKGKSCVTRRVADNSPGKKTPIESIALGMTRSCVKAAGAETSATLQPFYTLQLDIQDPEIRTLTDALTANFASEQLDGYLCTKTKEEIAAVKVSSLEELPPVLILHLKRFVYSANTGGVQKLLKPVTFTADLELPKNILSAECRALSQVRQRQYKLLSVVYHSGREAGKGHYMTDVWHPGYSCWLHTDDSTVSPTAEQLVLQPSAQDTPYLLFYRRADTMLRPTPPT